MKTFILLFLLVSFAVPATCQDNPAANSKPETQAGTPQKPTRIRVGGAMAKAQLLNRVQPIYPALAKQTKISGTVRLHAIISKEGSIQHLEVLTGHPLLVQSALDAVRQWKYKQTLLNGEPVEVDTTIDVIYSLAQDSPSSLMPSKIDPKLRDDIRHMLDVIGAAEKSEAVGRQMFDSMRPMLQRTLPDTPNRDKIIDAYENKLVKLFQSEEYQEGSIAAYAKYFDDQDIQDLTKFYETPVGKKFNDNLPAFTADIIKMAQTVAQQKLPGMIQELCKEYPELNGKFPTCRAADEDKKSQLIPVPGAQNKILADSSSR